MNISLCCCDARLGWFPHFKLFSASHGRLGFRMRDFLNGGTYHFGSTPAFTLPMPFSTAGAVFPYTTNYNGWYSPNVPLYQWGTFERVFKRMDWKLTQKAVRSDGLVNTNETFAFSVYRSPYDGTFTYSGLSHASGYVISRPPFSNVGTGTSRLADGPSITTSSDTESETLRGTIKEDNIRDNGGGPVRLYEVTTEVQIRLYDEYTVTDMVYDAHRLIDAYDFRDIPWPDAVYPDVDDVWEYPYVTRPNYSWGFDTNGLLVLTGTVGTYVSNRFSTEENAVVPDTDPPVVGRYRVMPETHIGGQTVAPNTGDDYVPSDQVLDRPITPADYALVIAKCQARARPSGGLQVEEIEDIFFEESTATRDFSISVSNTAKMIGGRAVDITRQPEITNVYPNDYFTDQNYRMAKEIRKLLYTF